VRTAVPRDGCPHYRRDELRISDVAQMFEKGW